MNPLSPSGTPSGSGELTIVAPRRNVVTHLREVLSYRDLIGSLIRKELKVRYKQSSLGLLWSMAQPMFLLLIYSLVFSVLNPSGGLPRLGIWIMSGLLVWTFVASSVSTSTTSITTNGPLVGKVRFPRAVLPTAAVGAAFAHLLLQFGAFAVVLVVIRQDVEWRFFWLMPVAILVLTIFLLAFGLLAAAANVYARDIQHLLDMLVVGWFWLTPVVYPFGFVEQYLTKHDLPTWLPMLNPVTPVVMAMQRALYGATDTATTHLLPDQPVWWYLRNLSIVAVASVLLLYVALRAFDRAEVNMAESL